MYLIYVSSHCSRSVLFLVSFCILYPCRTWNFLIYYYWSVVNFIVCRAGRCSPGLCFHSFSRVRYDNLLEYQIKELLRTPLQVNRMLMNCQYSSWVFSPSFGERASRLSYNMARVLALYHCYWVIMKKKFVYALSCINKVTSSVVRVRTLSNSHFLTFKWYRERLLGTGRRKDIRKFDFFRNSLYSPLEMEGFPSGHVLIKFWGCRDVCVICYSVPRATVVLVRIQTF